MPDEWNHFSKCAGDCFLFFLCRGEKKVSARLIYSSGERTTEGEGVAFDKLKGEDKLNYHNRP